MSEKKKKKTTKSCMIGLFGSDVGDDSEKGGRDVDDRSLVSGLIPAYLSTY